MREDSNTKQPTVFESEILDPTWKLGIFHKKNLVLWDNYIKGGACKEEKNPKRTTFMSVKISKINIYENNWQTTVHDPIIKNVVADALSKGYGAEK